MADAQALLHDWLEKPRDLLVEVGAVLQRSNEDDVPDIVPEMDLKLRDAYFTANACKRLLTVLRRAEPGDYDPVKTLRELAFQNVLKDVDAQAPEMYRLIEGDAPQVVECVRLVMENVRLDSGSRLNVQVTPEVGNARVVFRVHGSGTLPETIDVEGLHQFTIDEFADCWIDATAGGHIAMNEEGVILYLEGDRARPLLRQNLSAPLKAMNNMARRLRAWRGTVGNYEPGLVSHAEVLTIYRETVDRCLADLDQALAPA
jgi:hypothetical protein